MLVLNRVDAFAEESLVQDKYTGKKYIFHCSDGKFVSLTDAQTGKIVCKRNIKINLVLSRK